MEDALGALLATAGVGELTSTLRAAGITLDSLLKTLEDGRPQLLALLKTAGVSSLASRQATANALQRYVRTGSFAAGGNEASSADASTDDPGPAPPGSITITLRCAGALGGENCPLNGKFRSSRVHTKASTVSAFFEEVKAARGYVVDFGSVRASVEGVALDPGEAADKRLQDGMALMFFGPNRGG